MRRIAATRLYNIGLTNLLDEDRIREWCHHVLDYADAVLIGADNSCHSLLCEKLHDYGPRVTILLVEPWLGATGPLNALVAKALFEGANELVLQSSEVWIEKQCIEAMSGYLDEKTLVVGARISEEHAGSTGVFPLHGLNSPWNTMALWDLDKLARTGFLGISSGLLNGVPGGMEEVVTISLLQHLDPHNCLAKIFKGSRLNWAFSCMGPERRAIHRVKMRTKYRRAEQQLKYLGIPRGQVIILEE